MIDDQERMECWRHVLVTGQLPPAFRPVQGRLVRQVGRAELVAGPVFGKLMTFPRAKDRLRYLLRPLPAVHEARLLRHVAAAGIPCPEVLDVRTARRGGLPFRSWLLLRALPVATPEAAAAVGPTLLAEQAALALRLLAAGVVHPDLNLGNFVRLQDGRLAVLDLQSARRRGPAACARARLPIAARLLFEHGLHGSAAPAALLGPLQQAGLLQAAEGAAALAAAERLGRAFRAGRLRRCLQESTEFTCMVRVRGCEHRLRGALPAGRWWPAPRELVFRAWIGQRAVQLADGRAPELPAVFLPWRWLPGAAAVYVPAPFGEDRVRAALATLAEGFLAHGCQHLLDSRWSHP